MEVKDKILSLAEKVKGDLSENLLDVKERMVQATEKKDGIALKNRINLEGNFNRSDIYRNGYMLKGSLTKEGYDWWWHNFTGHNIETGEEKSFFIEFFIINPALGGDRPILGQLPENKLNGIKPSYMMVKAGSWGKEKAQLHRFFGINQIMIQENVPYSISAETCYCSESRTFGEINISEEEVRNHPEWMCDSGRMIWDLKIEKQVAFNVGYGTSKLLRDSEAFEMFWHAEGMKTDFSGTVTFNGKVYEIDKDTCYGYADKNWGSNFTSPWVWLSSNHLKSNLTGEWLQNTVFDIGGGRPKVGHISLERKLLGAMWYEGEPYEFNFSKFWTLTKTKFDCKETKQKLIWKIVQETPIAKMVTKISCLKEDMLLINYEAPDGTKNHTRLWNGGNGTGNVKLYKKVLKIKDGDSRQKPVWVWELVDDLSVYNAGCEYGEYN